MMLVLASTILVTFFTTQSFCLVESPSYQRWFNVVWNAPSQKCYEKYGINFNLSSYGIMHNQRYAFMGDEITLFYHDWLGTYPYVQKHAGGGHVIVHGGIPQTINMTSHLSKLKMDIMRAIPYSGYSGLAVIDWEGWWPLWKLNWGSKKIYRKLSLKHEKTLHPDWSKRHLRQSAKKSFHFHAKNLMMTTLQLAKQLRPYAKWGFYGYPVCFHRGHQFCIILSQRSNNRLRWLYKTSSGLFPSIYLKVGNKAQTANNRHLYIQARLLEALRVRSGRSTPIYAYTKFSYDTYWEKLSFYEKSDLCSSLSQSARLGLEGAVIWSSYSSVATKYKCADIANYVQDMMGPYVYEVTKRADKCSFAHCNNHGRCAFEPQPWCTAGVAPGLKLMGGEGVEDKYPSCLCEDEYKGINCKTSKYYYMYNFVHR